MAEEFDFSKWAEANGLTKKTVDTLKDQDLHVSEALALLTTSDITELNLTKGQTKLLKKAVLLLQHKERTHSKGLPSAPITTTCLAKNQGLEELIQKLDHGGGLDKHQLNTHLHTSSPAEAATDSTRIDLNPHVYLGKPSSGTKKEDKPLLIPTLLIYIPELLSLRNKRLARVAERR